MDKNKKIILICGVLVIILGSFLIIKNVSFAPVAEIQKTDQANNLVASTTSPKPETNVEKVKVSTFDVAWAVFQKYLGYNKDHNLDAVKSIVYKVNSICADKIASTECKSRMDSAYSYGSVLKKEDFVNVWSDEKQIILSTNFWTESVKDLDQYGRFRSIIFFIKGADDEWKLLSFSPTQGGATSKGSASQKEVDDRLVIYTEDKDQDGIADYTEQCLGIKEGQTCIKTDPKLRDTNGNGLWDGVEALMK
jgi:uncharacterized protein YxeA